MEQIVGEKGIISLAIPDKRRTFDFFKPISTTADVIEAYQQRRSRHSVRAGFLQLFYDCKRGAEESWCAEPPAEELSLKQDFAEASAAFSKCDFSESSPYLDFHAWFFTPASLELILLELNGLGLTKLVIREISDTMGCEFIAHLVRAENSLPAETFNEKRTELIRKVHDELTSSAELIRERARAEGLAQDIESFRAEIIRLNKFLGFRAEIFFRKITSLKRYDAAYYAWKEYKKNHIDRHQALQIIDDRYGVRSFFLLYPLYKAIKPFRKLKTFLEKESSSS
jgi:hypothetical protein